MKEFSEERIELANRYHDKELKVVDHYEYFVINCKAVDGYYYRSGS